ncbi:MAG: hypothetical protein LJE94_02855, partial [Deltaproteobacteria bacterium]|nr:hypothetical protein [Deltaproteobacteria bacterium]
MRRYRDEERCRGREKNENYLEYTVIIVNMDDDAAETGRIEIVRRQWHTACYENVQLRFNKGDLCSTFKYTP